ASWTPACAGVTQGVNAGSHPERPSLPLPGAHHRASAFTRFTISNSKKGIITYFTQKVKIFTFAVSG
ncbi:MAG: hypothetical protein MI741_23300, partial [Rhodospirillales bacterium]|nr:hypothetical protein [Rhodospirillales bacterium]